MDEAPVRPAPAKRRSFWLSKKFLLIILAIVAALLLWLFFIKEETIPGADLTKTSVIEGSRFSYPGNWQAVSRTDAEKKQGAILKLASDKPIGTFVWNALKGKLDSSVKVADLPDRLVSSLSRKIDGFQLLSKEVVKLDGHDAVKLRYTRPDPSDQKKVHQTVQYTVPRANQTDYLTMSASSDDLGKLESGLAKIMASYVSYTATHP